MAKNSALGKGLGALIDDSKYQKKQINEAIKGSIHEIEINSIEVNPFQPRKKFDKELIKELSASIKKLGIIQPITVNKKDNKYQLISGERRLRASKLAGLKTITAYVRKENDDQALLELALVENIQREDLNAIEISISYQRLIEECNLTQETLSERIGKKRSTIANYLRLLNLPAEIQIGIKDKKVSMGHAKSLISIDKPKEQVETFFKIVNEGLSVRKTEELSKEINNAPEKESKTPKRKLNEEYRTLKDNLKFHFNSNIQFERKDNGTGKIVIPFTTDDDLKRIIELIQIKSKNSDS